MKKSFIVVLLLTAFLAQAKKSDHDKQDQELFSDRATRAMYIGVAYAAQMNKELDNKEAEIDQLRQRIRELEQQLNEIPAMACVVAVQVTVSNDIINQEAAPEAQVQEMVAQEEASEGDRAEITITVTDADDKK